MSRTLTLLPTPSAQEPVVPVALPRATTTAAALTERDTIALTWTTPGGGVIALELPPGLVVDTTAALANAMTRRALDAEAAG